MATKVNFKQVVALGSMEAVKKAVELNTGVAIASHFLIQDEVKKGRLLSFSIDDVSINRYIMLVHRKNVSLSPVARAFIKKLKEDLIANYPKLYCGFSGQTGSNSNI
ncbi:LysR substrate-binding domain-containing protein [Enterovibrio sp. Hal110]